MTKLWEQISSIGITGDIESAEARRISFVNRIVAILCLFVLSSIIINFVLDSYLFIPVLSIALAVLLSTYLLNAKRYFLVSKILLMLTILALLTYMCLKAGRGSGLEFYFLSATVLPVIIFGSYPRVFVYQLLCILGLIFIRFKTDVHPNNVEPEIYKVFYVVNSFYSALLIILAIVFFRTTNEKHEEQLTSQKNQIQANNSRLQDMNKELDAFTYSVSHDLRAPLRTINGFSRILKEKYAHVIDDEGRELLDYVMSNARKMNDLINDLLEFSRSGKIEITAVSTDMRDLVMAAYNEIDKPEVKSRTELIVHPLPEVQADPNLMKQVFINLLSNALKYSASKPNPRIEVGCYFEYQETVFYVKDNGVGFDPSQSERLFNVFQRLHSDSEYEGTGVGLAIVRSIISRHGGRVWAEAETGKGAAFYFTLPAGKA
jgi:signal transduction histidine kinase